LNSELYYEYFLPKVRPTLHMKKLPLLKSILLIATGALLVSGCVTREQVVYRQAPPPAPAGQEIIVDGPPPPLIVETVTISSPGPDYIWIEGAWVWRGHWVWAHGHWARPPHPGAIWVPHRYAYHNGVHVYIHGYWRY
jgi:hypothetical protein